MSRLKAAVIGVGGIGQHHARNYREIPDVDLIAVCDSDEAALARVTTGFGMVTFTSYETLFKELKPDLVSIAVPTVLHFEVAMQALEHGIHVLVEKPISSTYDQAMELIEAAESRDLCLTVGHIERFNPAVSEVKKRIEAGELGQIFQIHAQRLSPFPMRIQDVGVVLDLAPHDIDIMRYLLGADVAHIHAELTRRIHRTHEDMLSGTLRFDNGTIGVLDINWLTPTKVRELRIIGEGGMYIVNYLTQELYWYKNAETLNGWDTLGILHGVGEGDMIKVFIQKKEPLRAELEAFANAVKNNSAPLVSGHDGLVAMDIAHKLIEAGEAHQVIHIRS